MPSSSKQKRGQTAEKIAVQTIEAAVGLAKSLNKGIQSLHRTFTEQLRSSEEPYCEISQTPEGMYIQVRLPNVRQKNITIKVQPKKINVVGKKGDALFLKTIDVSSLANLEKMRVSFRCPNLKITVPYFEAEEES